MDSNDDAIPLLRYCCGHFFYEYEMGKHIREVHELRAYHDRVIRIARVFADRFKRIEAARYNVNLIRERHTSNSIASINRSWAAGAIVCEPCHRIFKTVCDIVQHNIAVHLPNRCRLCALTFDDANSLRMHLNVHRVRNFPCPGCNKMYASPSGVIAHLESGTCRLLTGFRNPRLVVFDLCKALGGVSSLVRAVGGGKLAGYQGTIGESYVESGRNYRCLFCRHSFDTLEGLMQHQDGRLRCSGSYFGLLRHG